MNLKDYNKIKDIIDDIIGIDTIQGKTLKKAIRNYFINKPIVFKVSPIEKELNSPHLHGHQKHFDGADKAMEKFSAKLKKKTEQLKKKGGFCGISS